MYKVNKLGNVRRVKQALTFRSVIEPRFIIRNSRYGDSLWAVRSGDQTLVGAKFFAPFHTYPGAHPTSYPVGTMSFRGVKRPGLGADHPPPPSAAVDN
jgi:hypothetical protein